MRTYRCTSLDCGESFALERGKDKALPGTVYCPFCRNDAKTYATERRYWCREGKLKTLAPIPPGA